MHERVRSLARRFAIGAGMAAGAYGAGVLRAWYRYGSATPRGDDEQLDGFMPDYEIVERHRVEVRAPASVTFAAAMEMDLSAQPLIRAIFRLRELILCSRSEDSSRPRGLVDQTKALGWVVLREIADREIVMGAVTKPWEADVVFRSIPSDAFAAFWEPGYVKIVWTLRADPSGEGRSTFITETRAIATDPVARQRFRRYWSLVSPGIGLIRWLSLGPVRRDAERRASPPAEMR